MSHVAADSFESIRDYARTLLLRAEDSAVAGEARCADSQRQPRDGDDDEAAAGFAGCREAVEILTRNSKKGAWVFFFWVLFEMMMMMGFFLSVV